MSSYFGTALLTPGHHSIVYSATDAAGENHKVTLVYTVSMCFKSCRDEIRPLSLRHCTNYLSFPISGP